jgi:phosphopantothenoylcysteine decarboxylase/phosphopantothenate--cysteine ligase
MKGKRILLGICGGIAAYKIPLLIRELKKKGADVKCIMTDASSDFVSPLTIATLSQNSVAKDFWNKNSGVWANHVELALWADVFVIAPLTASSLGKMANGISDNFLLATYLSAKCPIIAAPAMDLDMYAHPTTSRNLEILKRDGVFVIPAETGELASGLVGQGRMAEPETILDCIEGVFEEKQDYKGRKVLITAGPTYESIDPVRFIGNHSTGKMGYALAAELLNRGAEVLIVSGPVKISLEHDNLKIIAVQSADDMLLAVQKNWKNFQIGIFSAAVADFRPAEPAEQKIKKSIDTLSIELIKNPDILEWAGKQKTEHQLLVGFALETSDVEKYAAEKLLRKNLDYIVMNTLEDEGAGFGHDTNRIAILDKHNKIIKFELKSKQKVAIDIVNTISLKKNELF